MCRPSARTAHNLSHVDLSAVIFVVLALAWALYLIPTALKHHDEVARTRSIDRFSNAMRVLARREPVNSRDTRLVVTPPRARNRMLVPTHSVAVALAEPAPAPAPKVTPAQRASARAAARRRRWMLLLLFLAVGGVAAAAYLGYLQWWTVGIPGGLVPAYLVLCRVLVRRERRARALRSAAPAVEKAPPGRRPAARVQAPYGTPAPAPEPRASEAPPAERNALWDPLPMTLPTYVAKPRVSRTVQTIDLSEPGSWSSGRSVADSRLVEEAAAAREAAAEETEAQRAVGS